LRRINDGYGHDQGDAVLAAFAQRLQAVLPATAVLARWGNDAFVAALEDLPPALLDARRELSRVADEVLEGARAPYLIGGDSVVASCSIGIGLSPHDAGDRDGLQRCADLALQQSRRSRRDSFRFFIEADMRRLDEEIRIESILREAIRSETVDHVWLPMFRLQDESCVGIESLLRASPALQAVDTGRIVEVAQARALLPALGQLCLRHNLKAWSELAASGRAPAIHHLCLNLTTQELLTPGFVDDLATAAEAAHLPPGRLVVEIAERDLFASLERLRLPLDRLVQQQVRIAIDGFGSGFSSLALLRDLPIAMIKIDRGFIWQLEASQRDREIVRAMIQLAHSLGVHAAAVGVETRAQLQALRAMGCDFAQGFLFSRPLALSELSRFLRPHAARQR
jgi:diguanylate cyclase (GGDEF)-like protein